METGTFGLGYWSNSIMPKPSIFIIAGPNGAGKTTVSKAVLRDTLGVREFVNADVIASGLSGFDPERAAFAAGRVMLTRLRELAAARESFAFETTLASRTFAPWLTTLKAEGWEIRILYVWVRSPDISVRRVLARVRKGGHDVPEDVVRRRYRRSIINFFSLYMPLAHSWQVYDNSGDAAELIAHGGPDGVAVLNAACLSVLEKLR
jgi:predicted ABC-type ATPase